MVSFLVIQSPVEVMVPLPIRSYFPSATKKVCHHSRAWRLNYNMQFTSTQVMVQLLVMGSTSALLTMQTATLIHTQTLVDSTTTLFQVEYKTEKQSWLGTTPSHLMTGRCFILVDSPQPHFNRKGEGRGPSLKFRPFDMAGNPQASQAHVSRERSSVNDLCIDWMLDVTLKYAVLCYNLRLCF